MAVLKGHEVRVPLKCGGDKVPAGAFVEAGVLSDRDAADLVAAGALGPEEMREFPDDGVSDVLLVVRADRPASDGNGDGEPRGTGAPITGQGAAAATAAPHATAGAASATVAAGFRSDAAAPKPSAPKPAPKTARKGK